MFLDELRRAGDSIGARINLIASGVPVGLGEPVHTDRDGRITTYEYARAKEFVIAR